MKTNRLIQYAVSGLVAGCLVANVADAKTIQTADATSAQTAQVVPGARPLSGYAGVKAAASSTYNVGPTSLQDVPSCVGPVSYCNLYFGS